MNKRKRSEEQGFFTFPGNPTHFSGSFRENIETLLKFGYLEASLLGHGDELQCHSFQLQLHQHSTKLLVLEADVKEPASQRCHYCHFAGWGHHIICSKRFHFVLPSSAALQAIGHQVARDWLKKDTSGSAKPSKTNCILMHGVMHSNGFGHLVEINNGFRGGSHFISGRQIMDLWDRICSALRVRKVSLIDVAMKGEMELRLVHGIAYGEPWFGRWGYRFGCGSYGATQEVYRHSLQVLRGLPLCCLSSHRLISTIIVKYQSFSEQILSTLSDLFRFMIGLRCSSITSARTCLPPKCARHAMDYHCQEAMTETPLCRWSRKRVAMAARVIVEKLKNSELQWVTRQAIRDAARAYVGDTGLLDYVLKTLGDRVFAGYIVRRKVNPITRVLEYCLEDISTMRDQCENRFRVLIMRDLLYLYSHILNTMPKEAKVVLYAKQLVKDFEGELRAEDLIVGDAKHHIEGGTHEGDNVFSIVDCDTVAMKARSLTVFEVESHIEDLVAEDERSNIKVEIHECDDEASVVDRDTIMMEARSVLDAKHLVKENEVELNIEDLAAGDEKGNITGEFCEGLDEINIVDCVGCGVKEEDGERMICCNICEVRGHTRCVGIADEEEAPSVFICGRCENEMLAWQSLQVML